MPEQRQVQRDSDAAVQHLVELGYVDPYEAAAKQIAQRRGLEVHFGRALEVHAAGHAEAAAAILERIAGKDADWSAPRQKLAELYYSASLFDKAQAQLDWLAHHGYEHPRFALIAGGMALARRDLSAALEELQYARHVDPNLPNVHTLLGIVLLRLRRWNEAEDAFQEATQQNLNDARARDGMAGVSLVHGEYEDAADWSLRALEQDMLLYSAHYHLGIALSFLNRPKDAMRALEASARVDPARAAPYYWLSRIAKDQLGDSASAARYREQARTIIRRRATSRQQHIVISA
jgi:predicted Zn-dependent protease